MQWTSIGGLAESSQSASCAGNAVSQNGLSLPRVRQFFLLIKEYSLWFHAAILDIFRPYMQENSHGERLRTFASSDSSPEAVCTASVEQLKRLITNYRLNYRSSAISILWHTALIYVVNAVLLTDSTEETWYPYLLLCVYGYERLGRSWRVAEGISKGLLSMILQKSDVPSHMARRIMHDIENSTINRLPGEIRATFMADLSLGLSNPGSATVEHLAEQFEGNAMLSDYTNIHDHEERN